MERSPSIGASAVLEALADLSPSTEQRTPGLAISTEWFRWLPLEAVRLFWTGFPPGGSVVQEFAQTLLGVTDDVRAVAIDHKFGERLAAVDQLRVEQRSLRVGWLFVAGRITTDKGRTRRVLHPLVTVPVRVVRSPALGRAVLVPAGDAEVSELVTEPAERDRLERHIETGRGALSSHTDAELPLPLLERLPKLRRYARSAAAAAGLPATKLVPAADGPDAFMRSESLAIVTGVGVYSIDEAGQSSRAGSLRAWADRSLTVRTAFHSLYLDLPDPLDTDAPEDPEPESGSVVDSPYLLTPVQRAAIVSSRHEPITLISGAPGTGKSHTIVAIAGDALARGERVLVAARSDSTVDALLDLLERGPGADPVVFGSNERRDALAARLAAGQLHPATDGLLRAAADAFNRADARRAELRDLIADLLSAEVRLSCPPTPGGHAVAEPARFGPTVDLALVGSVLDEYEACQNRWWTWARAWRIRRRLRALVDIDPLPSPSAIRRCLAGARTERAAAELESSGGLEIGPLWGQLLDADNEARQARGAWLAVECRSPRHLNRSTLGAVAALATALRSGRSSRREQLEKLSDDMLTRALPLWVGTLSDVDDLLPPVAGLFDLVILDEASSIDQPLAATALLRGRRAVVAGDPRQLRQVSFVSDAQLRDVVDAHYLGSDPVLASRLDVRRNSAFDLAAGVAPVLMLDEHFRSDPHLVDFLMRRLYGGTVHVATRSPTTESKDCVEVIRTDGRRDKAGVVQVEVSRVVAELKALRRAGRSGVGVVTPFRAQADAIEAAVLKAFTVDDIEALDLRIGTVHAFQGNERDIVIASLGIGPDETANTWRFVEDPHLFAVFMSRARRRMVILCSADPPPGGLVDAYLAQADAPPGPPKSLGEVDAWASSIADDLRIDGVPVITAYPTGRHYVDIAICDESRNLGIECGVHADGPEAHIERHLALVRSGWRFLEAYPSRWSEQRGELLVNLVGLLQRER